MKNTSAHYGSEAVDGSEAPLALACVALEFNSKLYY